MCGGGKVRVPGPTSEERQLQALQLASAQRSAELEQLTTPVFLEEYGYRIETDPQTGEQRLVEIPEEEYYAGLSPQEQQAYDISKLAGERQLKALRGELEVDPALEREIEEQELEIRERMARQLGPGWETSSPGIQTLAEQRKRAAELRDAMRRGEMTTSEALTQSRLQQLLEQQARMGQATGEPARRSIATTSALSQPLSYYANQRRMGLQANIANAQRPGFWDYAMKPITAGVGGISTGLGYSMWG